MTNFLRRMGNDHAILERNLIVPEGGQSGSTKGPIPLDKVSFVSHCTRSAYVSYIFFLYILCIQFSMSVFKFVGELDSFDILDMLNSVW